MDQDQDKDAESKSIIKEISKFDGIFEYFEESRTLPKKCSISSVEARRKANDIYADSLTHDEKTHKEILSLYNESIASAPADHFDEFTAMNFDSRSSFLRHLKRYSESIVDAESALRITKSQYLKFKLSSRIRECHANCLSRNCSVDDRKSRLQAVLPNSSAACFADCVNLSYDDNFGKHVVANRDIRPGEIIVIERGFVTLPKKDKTRLFCTHCLDLALNAIPCENCSVVIFCSEKCKEDAYFQYHDLECSILPYLYCFDCDPTELDTIILSIRSFVMAFKSYGGLQSLKEEVEKIDAERDSMQQGVKKESFEYFRNDITFGSLYSLLYHETDSLDEDDPYDLMMTNLIHKLKPIVNDCKNDEKASDCSDMPLFMKNLFKKLRKIIDINSFQFQSSSCKCQDFQECTRLCGTVRGTIILPCCSLLNHSCYPNVDRVFASGGRIIMFTCKPVKKGEQLFDCYGPVVRMEKKLRQEYLQDYYHFTCQCEPCKENWPTKLSCTPLIKRDTKVTKKFLQEIFKYKLYHNFSLPLQDRSYDLENLENTIKIIEIIYNNFSGHLAFVDSYLHRICIEKNFCALYGVTNDALTKCKHF